MLELLFFVLLLNFIYAVRNYYMYINPASSFIFGLLSAAFFSIIYKRDWFLDDIHLSTFIVISLGVTIFNIVSSVVWRIGNLRQYISTDPIDIERQNQLSVNNYMTFFVLIFIAVVCYWEYTFKLQTIGTSSIFLAVSEFDKEYKYGDQYEVPILLRNLILLRTCICYYYFYMLSKMIAMKDSSGNRLNVILICGVGLIGGFLSGSRGNVINYFLFSLFVWSIFKTLLNPKFRFFNLKKTVITIFAVFFFYRIISKINRIGWQKFRRLETF